MVMYGRRKGWRKWHRLPYGEGGTMCGKMRAGEETRTVAPPRRDRCRFCDNLAEHGCNAPGVLLPFRRWGGCSPDRRRMQSHG